MPDLLLGTGDESVVVSPRSLFFGPGSMMWNVTESVASVRIGVDPLHSAIECLAGTTRADLRICAASRAPSVSMGIDMFGHPCVEMKDGGRMQRFAWCTNGRGASIGIIDKTGRTSWKASEY